MSTTQEVSSVHSISTVVEKRDNARALNPHYICGFVDGEGCFAISVSRHASLKRKIEVRPVFEIELRADDRTILERIKEAFDCGTIYHLDYQRYGWYPHAKYKVSRIQDLAEKIVPFFDRYPLRAKKAQVFTYFREAVLTVYRKEHLSDQGFKKVVELRDRIRAISKKHVKPPGYGKTVRPVA